MLCDVHVRGYTGHARRLLRRCGEQPTLPPILNRQNAAIRCIAGIAGVGGCGAERGRLGPTQRPGRLWVLAHLRHADPLHLVERAPLPRTAHHLLLPVSQHDGPQRGVPAGCAEVGARSHLEPHVVGAGRVQRRELRAVGAVVGGGDGRVDAAERGGPRRVGAAGPQRGRVHKVQVDLLLVHVHQLVPKVRGQVRGGQRGRAVVAARRHLGAALAPAVGAAVGKRPLLARKVQRGDRNGGRQVAVELEDEGARAVAATQHRGRHPERVQVNVDGQVVQGRGGWHAVLGDQGRDVARVDQLALQVGGGVGVPAVHHEPPEAVVLAQPARGALGAVLHPELDVAAGGGADAAKYRLQHTVLAHLGELDVVGPCPGEPGS
mmetsp:Transcript_37988/g.96090  ORF Transcript_37988/g.96090 Transcript_37988/m.96090 type:complete len:377 (-) Transcript_37988:195-1325(-)